jgi:hypothetical protein
VNRAENRKLAAISRRPRRAPGVGIGKHAANGNKFQLTHVSWPKRIIKEMKQSPRVIEALASGKLDWAFK